MASFPPPFSSYAPFFMEHGEFGVLMPRDAISLPPGLGQEDPSFPLPNHSLAPNLQFPNDDRPIAAQTPEDATSNFSQGNALGHGEAFKYGQAEEDDEYYTNLGTPLPPPQSEGTGKNNRGDPKKAPPSGQFPQKLAS